jgi:hypothetical protein
MSAPASTPRPGVVVPALVRVATVLPPLIILGLIGKLAVNVPFQDDWDAVSVLIRWRQGTLGFADFWEQQSEHRILVVRVLMWMLGVFTDFNVVAEMFLGFGLIVLTLLFVRSLLEACLRGHAPELVPIMTAAASFMLFSLTLQEHWFFGTASVELVLYLVSVMLIWALTRWPDRWRGLVIAVCCAVVGTFTEASGLGLWLTGALAIWLTSDATGRRSHRLTLWVLAATFWVSAYMWGLHWGGSAVRAQRFVLIVMACLGLPFAYGSTTTWSAIVGLSGCVALGMAAVHLDRERPAIFRSLRPVLLLAIHGLIVSGMIAFGRSSLTPRFAMTSHYAIGGLFFWMATIVIAAMAMKTVWEDAATTTTRMAAGIVMACAALPLLSGYITANVQGYREAYQRSRNLEMALAALYAEQDISKDVSQFLYPPDDGRIHRQVIELKTFQLGPFSTRMEAKKARTVERFKGVAPTGRAAGFHDGGDCERTIGWAWDPARPDMPIMVDIWRGGAKIGTATANWFRWDLLKAGRGNGQHAFVFFFPTMLKGGTGERIIVTLTGSTDNIGGSPKVITCE